MTAAPEDVRWMRRALELAAKGKGRVEPKPPVGAVIIGDGRLLGEGCHERFGGPHAARRGSAPKPIVLRPLCALGANKLYGCGR